MAGHSKGGQGLKRAVVPQKKRTRRGRRGGRGRRRKICRNYTVTKIYIGLVMT
jgi:hypothetical protein